MKLCPKCNNKYSEDANFCPREECAGAEGPQRLVAEEPPARFVPISRVGGGASGEVWQASDAQSGGAVAYKIVAAESLPSVTALERAQRELRQLQRASNAHIVKVIEFGKTAEGRLFVASELASGEPLDQVVARSGAFPLDRAKRIAAQIGEALLEAQKVGVVHRDLAAKNVLISADDEVRLINFAIPRPLADNVFGVPEYMSPEQSEGKLIDQRSNTYSLGALLYLMLTGHPPHSGDSPRDILDAIQKGEITPPSIKLASGGAGASGGAVTVGLTTEVDRILLKALEKNSSRRPLTMRQFLTDVSGLIVMEPATGPAAGAPGSGSRDAAFARTMMFAGGASEVQKLVAQAVAARQAAGSNGAPDAPPAAAEPQRAPSTVTPPPASGGPPFPTGTPSPAAPVAFVPEVRSAGTPSPVHRPGHGAAVAATMVAMPAAPASAASPSGHVPSNGADSDAMSRNQLTPPPRSAAPGQGAGAGAGQTAPDANFRETLWFKKGDVDQMVAEARKKAAAAELAASGAAPVRNVEQVGEVDSGPRKVTSEVAPEDAKPLEDRYLDDGTVTTDDRKKFSLRSGATSTALPVRAGSIPGERMTEEEMIDEIGGGKRLVIIGIVAAVVVALIAVIAVSMKGKGKDKESTVEPAAAVAVPPTPVPPPPAPPAPPAAAPVEAAPAPAAVAPPPAAPAPAAKPEKRAAEAASRPAAKKHAAAKKKPAPPAKKRR